MRATIAAAVAAFVLVIAWATIPHLVRPASLRPAAATPTNTPQHSEHLNSLRPQPVPTSRATPAPVVASRRTSAPAQPAATPVPADWRTYDLGAGTCQAAEELLLRYANGTVSPPSGPEEQAALDDVAIFQSQAAGIRQLVAGTTCRAYSTAPPPADVANLVSGDELTSPGCAIAERNVDGWRGALVDVAEGHPTPDEEIVAAIVTGDISGTPPTSALDATAVTLRALAVNMVAPACPGG